MREKNSRWGISTIFEVRSAELCDTARYRGDLHLPMIVTSLPTDTFPRAAEIPSDFDENKIIWKMDKQRDFHKMALMIGSPKGGLMI